MTTSRPPTAPISGFENGSIKRSIQSGLGTASSSVNATSGVRLAASPPAIAAIWPLCSTDTTNGLSGRVPAKQLSVRLSPSLFTTITADGLQF